MLESFANIMSKKSLDSLAAFSSNMQDLWWLLVLILVILCIILFLFNFTKQVNTNSKKQIDYFKKNGKYIKGLFIELNNTKEFLRYFIFEQNWKQKIITQFNNYHDNYYDDIVCEKARNKTFHYKLSKRSSIEHIQNIICAHPDMNYRYDNFIKELNDYSSAITSKFLILTGSAGNGKTNLLCNIAELIMNINYTCVFLNARSIDSNVTEYFYNFLKIPAFLEKKSNIILSCINILLKIKRKKMFILIDAINENDSEIFQNSIAQFINEMLNFSNFKILLSCRSEYFEHRYDNLFKDKVQFEPLIYDIKQIRYSDRAIEQICEKYKKYFNFTGVITPKAFKMLSSSLLLMRIFFEVHKDSSEYIMTLNKFEIYEKYLEGIKEKNPNIYDLLGSLVKIMIENSQFDEISEKELGFDSEQLSSLRNVADENVLISRVIKKEEGTIAHRIEEIFYFVFDELRDYCIARQLIIDCSENNDLNFSSLFDLVNHFYKNTSSPLEGILRYSYNYFKSDKSQIEEDKRKENCKKILDNYTNKDISNLIYNKTWQRGTGDSYPEFHDFGISLILDCNKSLFDFEKQYIFEKLVNNNSDAKSLFDFLCLNEYYGNDCYSIDIFIEFLMKISNFEQFKNILLQFREEQGYLIYIFEKLNKENEVDNYYKFLIIWAAFFKKYHTILDHIKTYSMLQTVFDELELETQCEELKSRIVDFRRKISAIQNRQGEIN